MSSNILPNLPSDSYLQSIIFCPSSTQCTINCLTDKHCTGKTLICPVDKPCRINCHSQHSCSNTAIIANQSSHLTLYTFSSHAASNSNIYCPSSQSSLCQIYGDSSHHQWHNINIHINAYNHYQFICKSSLCSDDGAISLFSNQNHRLNICKLSNITYQCIQKHIYNRKLLSYTSTIPPHITTSTHYSSINAHRNPFGIRLTTAQLSWALFVIVLVLILVFCVLICLLICIWRQKKQNSDNKMIKNSHNLTENMSLKYLVLGYQDGRKIKIPFDISTLERLNNENDNENYISESLHAALSDEHNKIISAAILDANHEEESHNETTENTAVPSLNIDDHSIDVVMEDMDITQQRSFSSPNINTTLIKVGGASKQRIVQNSMSLTNSMDLVNGLKKYKTRKDSDVNADKDSDLTEPSYASDDELYKTKEKQNTINVETKRTHHQSSSHPQIVVPKRNKHHKPSPERPKTAHPISPKENKSKFEWNTPKTVKLSEHDSKSTQNSSWDSDQSQSLVAPNNTTARLRVSPFLQNHVPSMQLSASAPNINKTRFARKDHHMAIPIKSMSPSKRGRRTPNLLPKPHERFNEPLEAQPPHIVSKKVYQNAATMHYQMTMHHQRHQRVLQPLHHQRHQRRSHRHMSEPSNAYKGKPQADTFTVNMAPLQLNDDNTDHSVRTHSIRTRSRSHPTSPHKGAGTVWDNEYAGFIMNDDIYNSADQDIHNKHNKRSRYTKTKKKSNPFSRSTEFETKGETANINGNRLQIPIYSKSGKKIAYYKKDMRRSLEADHSGTTISDTPIPSDMNPIGLIPINIQYKTTTISSAFIPPPPSPQLTKSKHYTLSPPNSLKTLDSNTIPLTQQRGSHNTSSDTTTFDGAHIGERDKYDDDSESTLSQDTANSNANRVRISNQSEKTVTYKSYNVALASAETDETDPPPFEIHVQQPIDTSHSSHHDDNDDSDTTNTDTVSSRTESNSDVAEHSVPHFSKHYIVSSADSDKMMFIPPVPMHSNDESKDVPIRNPYAHRQLKPLPDAASIGTISPDWKSRNEYNYTKLKKYGDEEDEDESHNDEEKALNPKHRSNNPYLLEPKMGTKTSNDSSNISNRHSSSSKPPTFPNRASSSTHPPTFPSARSSFNNNHFFHQLTETIKTLTISQSNHSDNDEFIDDDKFRKAVDNNNIWHNHRELNHDYAE